MLTKIIMLGAVYTKNWGYDREPKNPPLIYCLLHPFITHIFNYAVYKP